LVAQSPRGYGPATALERHGEAATSGEDRGSTRRSYDAVAARYAAEIGGELDGKPLDRALLDALAERCAGRAVADVGCGPGHVAAYLAGRNTRVVAIDLSPAMCALAHGPLALPAAVADMTGLPLRSASLGGVVCWYAVIHLDRPGRTAAYAEMARVLRPGGVALVAFHTSDAEYQPGGAKRVERWWGQPVELTFRYLDPAAEIDLARAAGLELSARLDRQPGEGEHPSERTYLLLSRR
jgi:SAM-dependent methyltransferase